MPAPAHVQAATLQRFLDAWKKWDAEEWLAVFADDFTQVTLPFGLGIPPRPRAQVEQVLPALVATVKSYELTVHHVIHDVEKNKAAVYASSKGALPWGPWELEYSVFITFSEAGDKVARLEEMMDSAFLRDFGPKFGQYLQAHGGPTAVAWQ
ncbi:hypothetical protein T310_8109 [Rasamsonia emersonii CBS 393.64]|uniref:SnoaL-like domain-containing protein n=1 Tax=Rasamsonia emersonii (strain ATCC 16479 / CBS 393.64 / IMI 116815) TaxID=1408163 RepID=A0A0F4YIK0_RASE3|nr:hypothetical protein T310_8109 [Rasamsonia emersonii CBS 393.64]KKA17950.1 hypothetical protein T310_8109 [Rasamsonia emersonii CBS 393.64]